MKLLGIIGHGAFGQLLEILAKRFLPECEVRIYSSRHTPDNERFFSFEQVCGADVVIPAVPISAIEPTLRKMAPLLRKETVIVDTATVKMHTAKLLKEIIPLQPYVATHPMFGPESYKKKGENVSGFRIVITEHTLRDETLAECIAFLTKSGFTVLQMSPEEHDKMLAETLFLTHLLGQVVHRAGYVRTKIDSVSFGYLMDAIESVKNDTALFIEVYTYNPFCTEVLKNIKSKIKVVSDILTT